MDAVFVHFPPRDQKLQSRAKSGARSNPGQFFLVGCLPASDYANTNKKVEPHASPGILASREMAGIFKCTKNPHYVLNVYKEPKYRIDTHPPQLNIVIWEINNNIL